MMHRNVALVSYNLISRRLSNGLIPFLGSKFRTIKCTKREISRLREFFSPMLWMNSRWGTRHTSIILFFSSIVYVFYRSLLLSFFYHPFLTILPFNRGTLSFFFYIFFFAISSSISISFSRWRQLFKSFSSYKTGRSFLSSFPSFFFLYICLFLFFFFFFLFVFFFSFLFFSFVYHFSSSSF